MKREFLEGLNLDPETVDKIMAENGKDVNREKTRYADYEEVKAQLEAANRQIEKFADYDQTKADVEKYKAEAERAQREAAEKIARLEVQAKVRDFTGGKTFVNDFTREAINSQLEEALGKEESKGHSLEELFNGIVDGKTGLFKEENTPTPPTVINMAAGGATPPTAPSAGVASAPKATWNRFKG